jgi:hypothetical protein
MLKLLTNGNKFLLSKGALIEVHGLGLKNIQAIKENQIDLK